MQILWQTTYKWQNHPYISLDTELLWFFGTGGNACCIRAYLVDIAPFLGVKE
tara:strand:+ start:16230 stop:16385 length:156 start_codon:yes stop_codon:yes gene_type:complete